MEALLPRMTTPLLEWLQIEFFNQLTFSVTKLPQFIGTTEKLRFSQATLVFDADGINMTVGSYEGARMDALKMTVGCRHLDWQVASAAQIFNDLGTLLSAVERLTLVYISSEWNNRADRPQWRELLRPFGGMKELHVPNGLIGELSRSLLPENVEFPVELLPELRTLSYSGASFAGDAFTAFIDARQNAGHPVALHHYLTLHHYLYRY
ncbi:hypothetical protein BJV74DRAFT_870126 [Russula compacta]|nr:hypothetical protein BJV74DRAFT_870126 [Russula compacta]